MPRVVPDQRNKFETDELFKKVSQESDVSVVGEGERERVCNTREYINKYFFMLGEVYRYEREVP